MKNKKKLSSNPEIRKAQILQERFPDADIDWSREYSEVRGDYVGEFHSFGQDGKYFDIQGKQIARVMPNVKRKKIK
jgi:hypothetical protein